MGLVLKWDLKVSSIGYSTFKHTNKISLERKKNRIFILSFALISVTKKKKNTKAKISTKTTSQNFISKPISMAPPLLPNPIKTYLKNFFTI